MTAGQEEQTKPIVFLFGAGASYGAVGVIPRRPPLGRELYDELARFAPARWGPGTLIARYDDRLRLNFESAMDEMIRLVPSLRLLEWLRDLSRYCAQFELDTVAEDSYSTLLRRLMERGTIGVCAFASLNYDCLLELAAMKVRLSVAHRPPYADFIEVLKIHGSCNFITGDLSKWKHLLTNPGGHLGCDFTPLPAAGLSEQLATKFTGGNTCYLPVVSLYAWGKGTPVAGTSIQAIRSRFKESVLNASTVVIIGVFPNTQDVHFWTPLSQATADICCVGPDDMVTGWQSANARARKVGSRFEDSIDSILHNLPM